MNLTNLPRGVSQLTAMDLTPYDLISYCQSDPEFNRKICRDEGFWRLKLRRDYPNSANPGNYTNTGWKELYYKLTFKNLKVKVGNTYVGLDLDRSLRIVFKHNPVKNYSVNISWQAEIKVDEMWLKFEFEDHEAEKIKDKLGLKNNEDEIRLGAEVVLSYNKTNIFPKCALECTIDFIPIIEEDYVFWIYYDEDKLTMSFKYNNLSVKSLKQLIEQVEDEISEIGEVRYLKY